MISNRSNHADTIFWALVAYVVATGLVSLGSHSIFGTTLMRKLGTYGLYTWAIVIPLASNAIWILKRNQGGKRSIQYRLVRGLIGVCLGLAWLYATTLGLFQIMVNESWPLSLRHGPDTELALNGFEEHAGIAPPNTVTQIYFKSLGIMDRHDTLKFLTADPDVVQGLVRRNGLRAADSMKPGHYSLLDPYCIKEKANNPRLECYFKDTGRAHWFLRFDPVAGSVRFEMLTP